MGYRRKGEIENKRSDKAASCVHTLSHTAAAPRFEIWSRHSHEKALTGRRARLGGPRRREDARSGAETPEAAAEERSRGRNKKEATSAAADDSKT